MPGNVNTPRVKGGHNRRKTSPMYDEAPLPASITINLVIEFDADSIRFKKKFVLKKIEPIKNGYRYGIEMSNDLVEHLNNNTTWDESKRLERYFSGPKRVNKLFKDMNLPEERYRALVQYRFDYAEGSHYNSKMLYVDVMR